MSRLRDRRPERFRGQPRSFIAHPLRSASGYDQGLYGVVELGIARFDWAIEYMSAEEAERCEAADRVLRDGTPHRAPGYPRDEGTRIVRMHGGVFPPVLNAHALEAFTPTPGDPRRLVPYVAEWLWHERQKLEQTGALTGSAWCVRCGEHFGDERAGRGYVAQVARWCAICRRKRSRHLPTIRRCAADDCGVWFQPARANQVFHSAACKEAQRSRGDGAA